MSELDFLSGRFFDVELPKEKWYLEKYFKSDIQMQFLLYYYVFGESHRFREHAGIACSKRWLEILEVRYNRLVEAHKKAKENFDLETLTKIESGKCRGKYKDR